MTFDIDANGILHVSAKDQTTGKEQKIRIEASSGLTDAEIDRMVDDAQEHAEEDEERRDKVTARNNLDTLVYRVEKDAAEWGDQVSTDTKARLDEAIQNGKEALKGDDMTTFNEAGDELSQAFSAAGKEMYEAAAETAQAEASEDAEAEAESEGEGGDDAQDAPADDDVVEADYEIVDEEK